MNFSTRPSVSTIRACFPVKNITSRDLAEAIERRGIDALLTSTEEQYPVAARMAWTIAGRWQELSMWFPLPERVRVLAPLVPLYDDGRGVIGFYRVMLSRIGPDGNVLEIHDRPLGLELVRELLEDDDQRRALRDGWRLASVQRATGVFPAGGGVLRSLPTVTVELERSTETTGEKLTLYAAFERRQAGGFKPWCVSGLAVEGLSSCPE